MRGVSVLKSLLPVLAALVLAAGCATGPGRVPEEAVRVLAPEGKLRVALYPGTPTSILQDGGEPRGVGYELGRSLAQKLGVAFEPVVFPRNAEVLDAVKTGKADVAFTNASAARAREMDFSQPYLDIELGYLAAPRSQVHTLFDVDQPGVRVAVTEGSSSDGVLSRNLKNAVVVRAATIKAGVEMLKDGRADVYATNKSTLFEMADELPGAHVLAGNWGLERHAIAIPKGREAALPVLREFVDDARASGLVKAAIVRAGLRGAVEP
jgi:polar amino acid transport system substrate-binding protein